MRTLLTIIVTVIVTSAIWFATLRYRPMWIAKVMLDAKGFPRIKKKGDKYVVNSITYYFDGTQWVQLSSSTGFPVNPLPKEGDIFIIDNVGYKFTNSVWVKLSGPSENDQRILSNRQELINKILIMYKNHPSLNNIKNKLSSMSIEQLNNVVLQKVVWCVCQNTDYGFTTNCQLACA